VQKTGGSLLQSCICSVALGFDFPEHCLLESVRKFVPMRNDALSETAENVVGRKPGTGIRRGGARAPFIFPIREYTHTVIPISVR